MEYQEFNLQNISNSFFRIGFFSAVILLQNLRLSGRVNNFDDFMEWVDQTEIDNFEESEWQDASKFVNDALVEHDL